MDGPQFDAWTRRRFGLVAGSALATLAGPRLLLGADAKKKRRKRCKKLGQPCQQGAKRKCCGQLKCKTTGENNTIQTFCCKTDGKSCEDDFDCCAGLGCAPMDKTCRFLIPSDRNLKTNFASVDPADMLARVRNLPISAWSDQSGDAIIRHIGPLARDFAAIFGVGAEVRSIQAVDAHGAALAAIQGLAGQIMHLRQEQACLAARIRAIE